MCNLVKSFLSRKKKDLRVGYTGSIVVSKWRRKGVVEREALKGPRRGRRGRLCRHGKAKIAALLPHWVYDQHSGLALYES